MRFLVRPGANLGHSDRLNYAYISSAAEFRNSQQTPQLEFFSDGSLLITDINPRAFADDNIWLYLGKTQTLTYTAEIREILHPTGDFVTPGIMRYELLPNGVMKLVLEERGSVSPYGNLREAALLRSSISNLPVNWGLVSTNDRPFVGRWDMVARSLEGVPLPTRALTAAEKVLQATTVAQIGAEQATAIARSSDKSLAVWSFFDDGSFSLLANALSQYWIFGDYVVTTPNSIQLKFYLSNRLTLNIQQILTSGGMCTLQTGVTPQTIKCTFSSTEYEGVRSS